MELIRREFFCGSAVSMYPVQGVFSPRSVILATGTSFKVPHGRAIPFATGLKLAKPDLTVVVYSGDGDLISIGGNYFIHAARRNVDLKVICVNNFTYGMTGGQVATTTPYGCFEEPFNLPYLAESSGAVCAARRTSYHVRQVTHAMVEAFRKKGFTFIEILSPCSTLYERRNRLGDGLDMMDYFREKSAIQQGANTKDVGLTFRGSIVLGKFVDVDRPDFLSLMNQ